MQTYRDASDAPCSTICSYRSASRSARHSAPIVNLNASNRYAFVPESYCSIISYIQSLAPPRTPVRRGISSYLLAGMPLHYDKCLWGKWGYILARYYSIILQYFYTREASELYVPALLLPLPKRIRQPTPYNIDGTQRYRPSSYHTSNREFVLDALGKISLVYISH